MTRNTGKCKNKECNKPISESGGANERRYCEEHYQLSVEKNKANLQKRVSRIADRTLSIRKLRKVEDLISNGKVKEEIERKRINKAWISESIKRKSDVNDILKSREWKNTQELLKRRSIFCEKKDFMSYVKNVCQLYTLKLFFSREYLNKDNSYKKYLEPPITGLIPIVTMKLEVAFTFNIQSSVSMSSDDIILVPEKIRRMITLEKALLKKQLKNKSIKNGKDKKKMRKAKKTKFKKNKITKVRNGVYQRIKKENSQEDVASFIKQMRMDFNVDHRYSLKKYPPFFYSPVERSLPLFRLAQSQYVRIFNHKAACVFITLENELSAFSMYLEAYALLSLHALMSGRSIGYDIIKQTESWIENKSQENTVLYHIIKKIQDNFEHIFKVKITNEISFSTMYNSYFSEDVVKVSTKTGRTESIRKIIN